jgi:hypothetical protein
MTPTRFNMRGSTLYTLNDGLTRSRNTNTNVLRQTPLPNRAQRGPSVNAKYALVLEEAKRRQSWESANTLKRQSNAPNQDLAQAHQHQPSLTATDGQNWQMALAAQLGADRVITYPNGGGPGEYHASMRSSQARRVQSSGLDVSCHPDEVGLIK